MPPSDIRSDPKYLAAFTRFLQRGKSNLTPDELRVLNEGTNAEGGFVSPILYSETIAEVRQQSLAGLVSRVMTGQQLSVPYFTSLLSIKTLGESPTLGSGASYGLGASTDGTPFNLPNFGTSGVPDRRAFVPKKHGIYTRVTEELLSDFDPSLAKFLAQQIGIGLAAEESQQIVSGGGTPSGECKGIIGLCAAESRTVAANSATGITLGAGTANDLAALLGAVDASYIERGCFMMHPTVFVRHVLGTQSAAHSIEKDGRLWPTVYGLPVLLCSYMPSTIAATTTSVVFGDLSQYLVTESKPGYVFTAADQTHIASGQVGIYARNRFDGNVVQPRAFAALLH